MIYLSIFVSYINCIKTSTFLHKSNFYPSNFIYNGNNKVRENCLETRSNKIHVRKCIKDNNSLEELNVQLNSLIEEKYSGKLICNVEITWYKNDEANLRCLELQGYESNY
jgi:hypothetical protein